MVWVGFVCAGRYAIQILQACWRFRCHLQGYVGAKCNLFIELKDTQDPNAEAI